MGFSDSKIDSEQNNASLFDFLKTEIHRGYILENDEERYAARREKVYSLMQIPQEVEKFMWYGFLQCFDSFLFVCVFLPYRFILAFCALFTRPFLYYTGIRKKYYRTFLSPPEMCDLLKSFLLITNTFVFLAIDINVIYHQIKSQSIIKLYLIFNILEVGDRLLCCLGQDTIDALFWTATEPKDRKRNRFSLAIHLFLAAIYVLLHSSLVLLQATTLNVAINSENKSLAVIMMANNFVELKGSVFKKFDKNNLFQVSCYDVRERFHLFMLIQIVMLQTMKEYLWNLNRFSALFLNCLTILIVEVVVDWIKHAFITRFNDLQVSDVYREYTTSLAYDMTQIRQKHAFTDPSDMISRRMGFMPLPIVVCFLRVMYHCLNINSISAICLFVYGYIMLFSIKISVNLLVLGFACDRIDQFEADNNTKPKTPLPTAKKAECVKDMATSPLRTCNTILLKEEEIKTDVEQIKNPALDSTAIFSNSSLDLKTTCLNDEVLKIIKDDDVKAEETSDSLKRSESDPVLNNNFRNE